MLPRVMPPWMRIAKAAAVANAAAIPVRGSDTLRARKERCTREEPDYEAVQSRACGMGAGRSVREIGEDRRVNREDSEQTAKPAAQQHRVARQDHDQSDGRYEPEREKRPAGKCAEAERGRLTTARGEGEESEDGGSLDWKWQSDRCETGRRCRERYECGCDRHSGSMGGGVPVGEGKGHLSAGSAQRPRCCVRREGPPWPRPRLLCELRARGTLRAVAEALSYSPSAVSQQLALLQREADVTLIERRGRRLQLTPAGEMLADRSARL